MFPLENTVALVTGASRGVGKGIALGLGESRATVYLTGRTREEGKGPMGLPGTIQATAKEVSLLGGQGIAIECDHTKDDQVAAVFARIGQEHGRLDLLVNNVWGGYENMFENNAFTWPLPFWQQPLWRWEAMFQAGVRAHYVASHFAAPLMIERQGGLIVNISSWAAQKLTGNVVYGVAKAATDRMTAYLAEELRNSHVAVVSLYPGLVRTENVMRAAEFLDLSNSESPQFIGRAVAALAADRNIMERSGKVWVAASLAQEIGFTDIDGKQPRPLTLTDI